MVMKVGNIQSVFFRGKTDTKKDVQSNVTYPQIRELSGITPDFSVKLPQQYTKLPTVELDNGLKIHQYKLANGYRVSVVPMENSPAVVKSYVNVGSMNETGDIKGISHFLEHMAFNGTNGENGHEKLEVGDSFKKIDELGGWANASTNYAITDYVNSTPQLGDNDLEKQIKIIAAMGEDLKLSDDMIAKEKHPVCSEINMILDDPQTIAMDQTVRTLFNIKNPADELVGGSVKHIKNLTRKDVVDYYNKYYTPDNMNIVVTGDVNPEEVIKLVAKNFKSNKKPQGGKFVEKLSPIEKTVRKDFVNDKAKSTEVILGFAGPRSNNAREKVLFDVAKAYLMSYSVGLRQNLKQYNTHPYIDSEKISTNLYEPNMAYIACNTADNNSEKVLHTIFDAISSAPKPDTEVLKEIKQRILKAKENAMEFSSDVNNIVGNAVLNQNLDYISNYNSILASITPEDIQDGVKKYFDLNKTAITLVHPQQANVPTFKGKVNRKPINTNNIKEYKLDNNYDLGLCKTKNNNIQYNLDLQLNKPYNKKAGVIEVFDMMLGMGTASKDENEFSRFKEKNNLSLVSSVTSKSLDLVSTAGFEGRKLAYENLKQLLYEPRLTEENLAKAKEKIRDFITRKQDSAYGLYLNADAQNNPYDFSDAEILNNLNNITLADIKDCRQYFLENARGVITANIPAEHPEIEAEVVKFSSGLNRVKPNNIELVNVYNPNSKPVVLSKVNNNSQADIMMVHKFKRGNSIKDSVLGELTNSILTNSSIGLFNVLREKEHLAYSVYSNIEKNGDLGEISCNILTTTDNKDIGEISYENVQKSIDGFKNQINELKSGKFTEQDLENAKLSLKANLLQMEGTDAKLGALDLGLNSKYGITYSNQLYDEIDKIAKDDILNYADKIFKNPPIYSIVASKDTLENNKDYLDKIKEA